MARCAQPLAGSEGKPISSVNQIELRLARFSDATGIARLSRDLIETGLGWSWRPERIARHIRAPDSVVLEACVRECLAGFAIMQFGDENAHLNLLAVRPQHQRAGIGRKLVEWLEGSARVAGIVTVTLEVRARNRGARRFYRKLGYREIAFLQRYYGTHESAVRMFRDLRWVATD